MSWEIVETSEFARVLKKHRKNAAFADAFAKKVRHLQENPESLGGHLAGRLHGYKSVRILRNFRLVFKVVPAEHSIYLIAIDHRKFDYENFSGE